MAGEPLLNVTNLCTYFPTRQGVVKAVDGVNLDVQRGEIVGLVGESGSGKSITGFSILGLLDPPGRVVEVGSSRVDLQACKLEYSIVSPK